MPEKAPVAVAWVATWTMGEKFKTRTILSEQADCFDLN